MVTARCNVAPRRLLVPQIPEVPSFQDLGSLATATQPMMLGSISHTDDIFCTATFATCGCLVAVDPCVNQRASTRCRLTFDVGCWMIFQAVSGYLPCSTAYSFDILHLGECQVAHDLFSTRKSFAWFGSPTSITSRWGNRCGVCELGCVA